MASPNQGVASSNSAKVNAATKWRRLDKGVAHVKASPRWRHTPLEEQDERKSARYAKHMQSKVALQKIEYDTEKLLLQAMFNTMGVAQKE